jgi:hypothetical protein
MMLLFGRDCALRAPEELEIGFVGYLFAPMSADPGAQTGAG